MQCTFRNFVLYCHYIYHHKGRRRLWNSFSIGGQILSNLTYADDITLINQSQKELQRFLDCLVKYSSEVGLYINVGKQSA